MFSLYNQSLALLTDLYEIAMAYAYWKKGMAEDESVFHLFFRKKPFNGGFAIAAGLESVIDYLCHWHFDSTDLDYLSTLQGPENGPLFEENFLTYLSNLRFSCNIDAVREGDVVFPYEPLIRVQGSILQAQLLETPLLTLINFPSLIATKASRIKLAAQGDPVLEFGLRRAQGIDGAMSASRSAYIGGCDATSNTLAGKILGIPVKGTHAHSWVLAFETELESFQAYAEALPSNTVFLVDTYDTIQGVQHAIEVGKQLRMQGRPFLGIRLDSGDLAYLSIQSRKMLDEAGFKDAKIYASNELNEELINDLKSQGAKVGVWGVGTHLSTAYSQPALDGVYKLSAFRKKNEEKWTYKLKLSERMKKISDPGILQVRRYMSPPHGYIADAIYDIHTDLAAGCQIIDPLDPTRKRYLSGQLEARDLLVPVFKEGELIYKSPSLKEIREFSQKELSFFDRSIKRFQNPHNYPVGMESSLYSLKLQLIEKIRKQIER